MESFSNLVDSSAEGTLVYFERKESLPEDFSESGGGWAAAAAPYQSCAPVELTAQPAGVSCREQRKAELRQAERDKFGTEIQTISHTLEGMVSQVATLLQENSRLPEKDRSEKINWLPEKDRFKGTLSRDFRHFFIKKIHLGSI